jgi:hypothetical protein
VNVSMLPFLSVGIKLSNLFLVYGCLRLSIDFLSIDDFSELSQFQYMVQVPSMLLAGGLTRLILRQGSNADFEHCKLQIWPKVFYGSLILTLMGVGFLISGVGGTLVLGVCLAISIFIMSATLRASGKIFLGVIESQFLRQIATMILLIYFLAWLMGYHNYLELIILFPLCVCFCFSFLTSCLTFGFPNKKNARLKIPNFRLTVSVFFLTLVGIYEVLFSGVQLLLLAHTQSAGTIAGFRVFLYLKMFALVPVYALSMNLPYWLGQGYKEKRRIRNSYFWIVTTSAILSLAINYLYGEFLLSLFFSEKFSFLQPYIYMLILFAFLTVPVFDRVEVLIQQGKERTVSSIIVIAMILFVLPLFFLTSHSPTYIPFMFSLVSTLFVMYAASVLTHSRDF